MTAKRIDQSVLFISPGDYVPLETKTARCEVHQERVAVAKVCVEHDFKANTITFVDCCEECLQEISNVKHL